jgi:hypothetical protein
VERTIFTNGLVFDGSGARGGAPGRRIRGSAVPRGGVWLVKPVVQDVISESGQRQA